MTTERGYTPTPQGTDTPSLGKVVERVLAGNNDLWPALIERLAPTVRTTLARYDVDEQLKQDAEAETWRVLFERLDRVNQPERLHGWISVVASNRLVDLLRRPEYRFATAVLDEAQLADPSEDDPGPLDPEVTLALTAAVERLSPREQTVLRARILTEEPIPLKEIERRFAIPQGSVGPTLNRSVAKLRTDPDLSQKLLQCEPDRMTPMLKLAG